MIVDAHNIAVDVETQNRLRYRDIDESEMAPDMNVRNNQKR